MLAAPSSFPSSLAYRSHPGDEDPKETGHASRQKADAEEHHQGLANLLLMGQLGAIAHQNIGNGCCQNRRQPRDVLLPLHTEGVPGSYARVRQQVRLGELHEISGGWGLGPVPGIDEVGAGNDGQPHHNGHEPGACEYAAHSHLDTGHCHPLNAQAPEASQNSGTGEEQNASQAHAVDDRPEFRCCERHAFRAFARCVTAKPPHPTRTIQITGKYSARSKIPKSNHTTLMYGDWGDLDLTGLRPREMVLVDSGVTLARLR